MWIILGGREIGGLEFEVKRDEVEAGGWRVEGGSGGCRLAGREEVWNGARLGEDVGWEWVDVF